ncbi:MAG TPA: sulfite exporter TauE/SafE family protein [Oligoflexia bacterium]|nr:sulfite exporter TauE/SafE family protein [Oligoflexia bacterium]HMR24250.1 sulfite exporter TauE/SafE family protein [Oligoflexia bacterium]
MEHGAHHITELTTYSSFFVLGFLTSFHCIGMCGPIAMLFISDNDSAVKESLKYNFSRLISYIVVGTALYFIGTRFLTPQVKKISALFLIIVILSNSLFRLFSAPLFIKKLFIQLQSSAIKVFPKKHKSVGVGLFSGIFPCGMLYAAYIAALTTPNIKTALISLIIFALGTMPMLFGVNVLGVKLFKSLSKKNQQYVYHTLATVSLLFIFMMNFMYSHSSSHMH